MPAADLVPGDAGPRHGPGPQPLGPGGRTVLTPDTGFGVHSTDGEPLTLRLGSAERVGAAFRPPTPTSTSTCSSTSTRWSGPRHYPAPLRGMEAITGLMAFFTEHVDGVRATRPVAPWS